MNPALDKRIRALTFDVGGTLLDPWPSVGHVYASVAARHGYDGLDAAALTAGFEKAWQGKAGFDYSRAAWRGLVERTFEGQVNEEGVGNFFEALYDHFGEPDPWRVYEDVVPALQALRERGYLLGVVSNWDERLRPLLERLGLGGLFNGVAVSHEVGVTKPDRGLFDRALGLLGVEAGEVWHVGDSLGEDCEGASAAGMGAVWIRRGRRGEASGPWPMVKTLWEVVEVLEKAREFGF